MKQWTGFKRIIAGVLALTLVVGCASYISWNREEVQASSTLFTIDDVISVTSNKSYSTLTDSSLSDGKRPVQVRVYIDGELSTLNPGEDSYYVYTSANDVTLTLSVDSSYKLDAVYYTANKTTSSYEDAQSSMTAMYINNNTVSWTPGECYKPWVGGTLTKYYNYVDIYLKSVTTFSATMYDYDKDGVNQATANLVAAALAADGYTEEMTSATYQEYPAIVFTNCGGEITGSATYYSADVPVYYTDWQGNQVYSYTNYIRRSLSVGNYYNETYFPWNVCTYYYGTTGMVDSKLGSDGLPQFNYYVADLFGTTETSYKQVYEKVAVDFVYEDGYYVLDSDDYSYTMNSDNTALVSGTANGGFWPYGSSDCWFGMHLSVNFFMTTDGTYNDEDCIFEFSGDDDVFVYLDDTLALDLGGIHGAVGGTINFADQVVTYNVKDGDSYREVTETFEELGLSVNDNKTHTLSVFYVERGAGASNCKIKFNMPTINSNETIKGDYTFAKLDGVSKDALTGAGFTLYSDSSCTQVAKAEVTAAANGLVTFTDLTTGVYYLKETTVPNGYSASDIYVLTVAGNTSSTLTFTLTDLDGTVIGDTASVNSTSYTAVYNYEEDLSDLTVDKTSTLVSWDDRTYEIALSATGSTVTTEVTETTEYAPVDVILILDASYSMYYPSDLSAYDRGTSALDKNQTYYFVTADASAVVYKVYYDSSSKKWKYYDSSLDGVGTVKSSQKYDLTESKTTSGSGWSQTTTYTYSYGSGTTISQFYTSASNGTSMRISELKTAAKNFVSTLAAMNADTKIGIVYFNSTSGVYQSLTTLSAANVTALNTAIDNFDDQLASGTSQERGMATGYTMLNDASIANDGRSKYVVLLTDGCPNSKDDSGNTKSANTVITACQNTANSMVSAGATMMAIGIDINTYMSSAEKLLQAVAPSNYTMTASSDLSTVFSGLANTIRTQNATVSYYSGTVVDVLDDRFYLTEAQQAAVEATGAVVTTSGDNTIVTWNNVTLRNWEQTFRITAKETYAGGNDIYTNTSASGVYVDGEWTYFPMPKVNVKLKLTAGDAEDTIFLGEDLPLYFTDDVLDQVFAESTLDTRDLDSLAYSWTVDGETVTGSLADFQSYVQSQAPTDTENATVYELTVVAVPKTADDSAAAQKTADDMKMNDTLYTASMQDTSSATSVTVVGTYTVYVITGSLTITKTFEGDYLDTTPYSDTVKDLVDANQTAVFTVEQYASADVTLEDGEVIIADEATPLASYEVAITGDENGEGSVTLSGLSAGVYVVTEDTGWSWKYTLTDMEENLTVSSNVEASDAQDGLNGENDAIVWIGKRVTVATDADTGKTSRESEKTYQAYTIEYTDTLKKKYYYFSDTTNVVNRFEGVQTGEDQ